KGWVATFRKRLDELGWRAGDNLQIEERWTAGDPDRNRHGRDRGGNRRLGPRTGWRLGRAAGQFLLCPPRTDFHACGAAPRARGISIPIHGARGRFGILWCRLG